MENNRLAVEKMDYYIEGTTGSARDLLFVRKGDKVGALSLDTGKLILPFGHHYIDHNTYEDNNYREHLILRNYEHRNDIRYSLYHIPSHRILIDDFDYLSFASRKYLVCRNNNHAGVVELIKNPK